jgi:hypothetical protein
MNDAKTQASKKALTMTSCDMPIKNESKNNTGIDLTTLRISYFIYRSIIYKHVYVHIYLFTYLLDLRAGVIQVDHDSGHCKMRHQDVQCQHMRVGQFGHDEPTYKQNSIPSKRPDHCNIESEWGTMKKELEKRKTHRNIGEVDR